MKIAAGAVLFCVASPCNGFEPELRPNELYVGMPILLAFIPHGHYHYYPIEWVGLRARLEHIYFPEDDNTYGREYYGAAAGIVIAPLRRYRHSVYGIFELGKYHSQRGPFSFNGTMRRFGLGYQYQIDDTFIAIEYGVASGPEYQFVELDGRIREDSPQPLISFGVGLRF